MLKDEANGVAEAEVEINEDDVVIVEDYNEIAKFIIENANIQKTPDPTERILQLNKEPHRKFMKSRGISSDILTKYATAHNAFLNGAIEAATQTMIDSDPDVEKVTIRVRTETGREDTTLKKSIGVTNPKTGEKAVKYGSIGITTRSKTLFNQDLLRTVEKRITEAFAE